jgi:hypothetical protein
MPYWLSLCVLHKTCRHNRLHETLFHIVIILSKHHYHYHQVIVRAITPMATETEMDKQLYEIRREIMGYFRLQVRNSFSYIDTCIFLLVNIQRPDINFCLYLSVSSIG